MLCARVCHLVPSSVMQVPPGGIASQGELDHSVVHCWQLCRNLTDLQRKENIDLFHMLCFTSLAL